MVMKTLEWKGGRHAVLALHGLLSCPVEMQYVGRMLAKSGYAVRAPVIKGYSFATLGTTKVATAEHWLAEVENHFNDLRQHHDTVSVTGLCIGAVLAMKLAIRRGSDVAALGLLAPVLAYDGWGLPRSKVLLPLAMHTPLRHVWKYQERFPYGLKNENMRRWIEAEMKAKTNSIAGAASLSGEGIYQAHRLIGKVKRQLRDVTVPTLIVHALEDDVTSIKSANLIESRISSAIQRKVLLHNSYHMVTLDNDKDQVASETIAFFDQYAIHKNEAPEPVNHVLPLSSKPALVQVA